MEKNNFKLNIMVILSLCFAGLVIFGLIYFLSSNQKEQSPAVHQSNPPEKDFFETAFQFDRETLDLSGRNVVAGVIPHHLLAADLIAEFFRNLPDQKYDTVILIGPNHYNSGDSDIIISDYDWQTPYGISACDHDAVNILDKSDEIAVDESAMANEHAINAEVSFIKKILPDAEFLPIILKSNVSQEQAEFLANELSELGQKKNILVLASVDFSHYQDSLTAQQNDQISISAITDFDFDKIYDLDIDSPASICTLLKFSRLNGAEFLLLNNSNSAILSDKPDLANTTSYVTGYFVK